MRRMRTPFRIRRRSPMPLGRRPRLELRRQPLYDANNIASTTAGTVNFFRDSVGQNTKTLLHTNLEKGGSLPHPRIFDIHGISFAINQALTAIATGLPATELNPHVTADFSNGLKGLMYSAFFQLFVGTKPYVQAPLFLMPSNARVEGAIIWAEPETTNFATGHRTIFGSPQGMMWSTQRRRIRLLPDQVFYGELTLPITGAGQVAGAGKLIYCFLNGLEYREVQ